MFKNAVLFLIALIFFSGSTVAMAEVGTGEVKAKSGNVDISVFGSLKTYPHFISDMDFNEDDTAYDWMLDESGIYDDDTVTVRNEFRLGFIGEGKNWTFMTILESDFALDKGNTDRGARGNEISNDSGFTGEDFGVEKLEFTYDFTSHGAPFILETGWNTKFLDIETGGVLYGDDHPYIGLKGTYNDIPWEVLTLFVFDDAGVTGIGDAHDLDHTVYTAKAAIPVGCMKVVPFY